MKDLEILQKLVAGLRTLRPSEFLYSSFVTKYDTENQCGTVCCAWGWMPKFVPEAGVKWDLGLTSSMSKFPHDLLKINIGFIRFLFYGHDLPTELGEHDYHLFGDGYNSTLKQVINRIDFVIEKLVRVVDTLIKN